MKQLQKPKQPKLELVKLEPSKIQVDTSDNSNIANRDFIENLGNIFVANNNCNIVINDSKLFELILLEIQSLRNEIKQLKAKK